MKGFVESMYLFLDLLTAYQVLICALGFSVMLFSFSAFSLLVTFIVLIFVIQELERVYSLFYFKLQ